MPGEPVGKDSLDMRRRGRIRVEAVQAPAPAGMRGVRVRPPIDQPVPVRRSATQVAALLPYLDLHRRQGSEPRSQHLTLGLMTEQHRQRGVRWIGQIHRPAELGEPQLQPCAASIGASSAS